MRNRMLKILSSLMMYLCIFGCEKSAEMRDLNEKSIAVVYCRCTQEGNLLGYQLKEIWRNTNHVITNKIDDYIGSPTPYIDGVKEAILFYGISYGDLVDFTTLFVENGYVPEWNGISLSDAKKLIESTSYLGADLKIPIKKWDGQTRVKE